MTITISKIYLKNLYEKNATKKKKRSLNYINFLNFIELILIIPSYLKNQQITSKYWNSKLDFLVVGCCTYAVEYAMTIRIQ